MTEVLKRPAREQETIILKKFLDQLAPTLISIIKNINFKTKLEMMAFGEIMKILENANFTPELAPLLSSQKILPAESPDQAQ